MSTADSFGAKGTLRVGHDSYTIYRLSAVHGDGLEVDSLPYSLKVLLENLLRSENGSDITADDVRVLAGWDADADPSEEIQFSPARVIMQDFTGVPAVVDLATPIMASEDFSWMLRRVPGAMVFLGTQPPGAAEPEPIHSTRMMLDETQLATGAALHAAFALRVLAG